jgi:chromosome segregation ATPase
VPGTVTNRDLLRSLQELHAKVDVIMTQQDDINAEASQIEADVAAEGTALAAIKAEIASLQQQNPALDLSGLQAAVAQLDTETAAEQAAAPPAG